MPFYAPLPDPVTELQQGDLLAEVPFSYFPLVGAKVVLTNGENATRDLSQGTTDVEFVTAKVQWSWGLVLSQTCDMQSDPQTGFARKSIVVARVRPIQQLIPDFSDNKIKNAVKAVKSMANPGKTPSVFYLPAYQNEGIDLPRSGTNLLDVQRFANEDLLSLRQRVRLRLADAAIQALQERCAYCFGRFGAPDDLYFSAEEWAEEQRR